MEDYSISEMVEKATAYYALDPSKASKRATRETIVRDLKKQGVWEQNVQVVGEKRGVHYFDLATMTNTLYVRLEEYFGKRAGEAWKLAKEMSAENRKRLITSSPTEDEIRFDASTVSY
ncbi:MAG: hypothetical protein K6E18_05000, partial [Lachnospiraceae bacterium]|nr:hypothetical protein [Lachnospiraceae bacterium]